MTDATSATSATPTIVFVHGAWADASGFGGVIRTLGDHSYGGAVMSNAAVGNEQVQALVFVNGWMPDEGESIQQLFGVAAGGRDAADPERRRGNQPQLFSEEVRAAFRSLR